VYIVFPNTGKGKAILRKMKHTEVQVETIATKVLKDIN
jgi:hypothetical protein